MSLAARWMIAAVGVLFGSSVLWFGLIQPIAASPPAGKLGIIALALVCFAISAVCFPGPLRNPAARLIGAAVFLSYLFYAVDRIGKPLFPGGSYDQSELSLPNALMGMCLFGIPGAFVMVTGRFPTWTLLRDRFHTRPANQSEDLDAPSPYSPGVPGPDEY